MKKKKNFFIPSIEYVAVMLRNKNQIFYMALRRYKTLRSSTNCECGHLMTHFVGIAIKQQFIVPH